MSKQLIANVEGSDQIPSDIMDLDRWKPITAPEFLNYMVLVSSQEGLESIPVKSEEGHKNMWRVIYYADMYYPAEDDRAPFSRNEPFLLLLKDVYSDKIMAFMRVDREPAIH